MFYQGALNKGRGLEYIIEAMKQLPLKLKIAGEGDLSLELRALVKTKGLADKIEFLGWVNDDELHQYASNAWLGINLLENLGKSYYNSLNNKFFDYMQAELPSLSPAFPEFVAVNQQYPVAVLINDPKNIKELIRNINKLLTDSYQYSLFKTNTKLVKNELNWSKESDKLVNLYKQLALSML